MVPNAARRRATLAPLLLPIGFWAAVGYAQTRPVETGVSNTTGLGNTGAPGSLTGTGLGGGINSGDSLGLTHGVSLTVDGAQTLSHGAGLADRTLGRRDSGLHTGAGLRLVPGMAPADETRALGAVETPRPDAPRAQAPHRGQGAAPLSSGGSVQDVRMRVEGVGQNLTQAQSAAAKGDSGAVETTLNQLFEDDRKRAAAALAAMPAGAREALPDPKRVGPARAVEQTLEVAARMSPADAPAFYRLAAYLAQENLPASEAEAMKRDIFLKAARKAPDAVRALVRQALAEAVESGASPRSQDRQERMLDGIDFFNARLRLGGAPYLENAEGVKAAVRRLASIAKAAPSRRHPAPAAEFEVARGVSGRAVFKAVISAEKTLTEVPAIAAADAAFALKPAEMAAMELDGPAPFAGDFDLLPDGAARFTAVLRERRAAGDSWLLSLMSASGNWASWEAGTLWSAFKRLLARLASALGLVRVRTDVPDISVSLAAGDEKAMLALLDEGGPERTIPIQGGGEVRVARSSAKVPEGATARFAAFQALAARHARAARDAALLRAFPQPATP
ncbi:MAG: hypothetical protein HY078_16805 [Elusimicrobia bacterium]|nr:hypothetical protein [Elusimicrobiota bacterium]